MRKCLLLQPVIMTLTFKSMFQALGPLGIGVATGEQVGKCDSTPVNCVTINKHD